VTEFDEFSAPAWLSRIEVCRYFGLADDDQGWDTLNEIVFEFDLDAELGPNGDVLRVDANQEALREVLFVRHEREVGHRPDDAGRIAEARQAAIATAQAQRDQRDAARADKLAQRVQERRAYPVRRIDE
jgi:hypothetical protein